MKLTIKQLRDVVRESFSGSSPEESYNHELESDPAYKKKSVLVPDDIKKSIKKWSHSMGLSGRARAKQTKRHI